MSACLFSWFSILLYISGNLILLYISLYLQIQCVSLLTDVTWCQLVGHKAALKTILSIEQAVNVSWILDIYLGYSSVCLTVYLSNYRYQTIYISTNEKNLMACLWASNYMCSFDAVPKMARTKKTKQNKQTNNNKQTKSAGLYSCTSVLHVKFCLFCQGICRAVVCPSLFHMFISLPVYLS